MISSGQPSAIGCYSHIQLYNKANLFYCLLNVHLNNNHKNETKVQACPLVGTINQKAVSSPDFQNEFIHTIAQVIFIDGFSNTLE